MTSRESEINAINIRDSIKKAYQERENNQIVTHHDSGNKTVTTFYMKGSAVHMVSDTGCIHNDNRVYSVDTKPYVRDFGRRWYLDDEHIELMNKIRKEA